MSLTHSVHETSARARYLIEKPVQGLGESTTFSVGSVFFLLLVLVLGVVSGSVLGFVFSFVLSFSFSCPSLLSLLCPFLGLVLVSVFVLSTLSLSCHSICLVLLFVFVLALSLYFSCFVFALSLSYLCLVPLFVLPCLVAVVWRHFWSS